MFELPADCELPIDYDFTDDQRLKDIPDNYCISCIKQMVYSEEENRFECECGQISYNTLAEEYLNSDSKDNHNTSKNSAVQLRFKGENSGSLQRALVSSTSSYDKTRERAVRRQLETWLYQSRKIKIPVNIVKSTGDFFIKNVSRQNVITRGAVRKGIMAAILYYECKTIGYGISVTEICESMSITRNDWSRGDSRLRELEAKGCFILPSCEDCTEASEAYLNMFLPRLQIEPRDEYFTFANELIELMNNPKVGKLAKNSMPRSKCAGIVHLLCKYCSDINISDRDIVSKCSISKATFTRVSGKIEEVLHGNDPAYRKRKRKLIRIFKIIGYTKVD